MENACELRGGAGCSKLPYVLSPEDLAKLIAEALGKQAPGMTAAQVDAKIAALSIPTPTTANPQGVGDMPVKGDPSKYEPAGHVHPSKARKARVTGVNTATYVWTYPTPFGAGVVPICNGIAEDPADSALDSYNVQIVGVPTNTQCTFRIKRQTSGLFGLLTGAIGFNPAPGTINLHLSALEP